MVWLYCVALTYLALVAKQRLLTCHAQTHAQSIPAICVKALNASHGALRGCKRFCLFTPSLLIWPKALQVLVCMLHFAQGTLLATKSALGVVWRGRTSAWLASGLGSNVIALAFHRPMEQSCGGGVLCAAVGIVATVKATILPPSLTLCGKVVPMFALFAMWQTWDDPT